MKKLLIPILMVVVGFGAGAGAGLLTGGKPEDAAPEEEAKEPEKAPEEVDKDAVEFARLNNQFIVPVVREAAVEAMVVLSLTLEVSEGGTETVFENEPRLRDRFLRVLFDHANIGGFDSGFTQTGAMTLLRTGLLEAAQDTLGPLVHDVLIVDIVRQET